MVGKPQRLPEGCSKPVGARSSPRDPRVRHGIFKNIDPVKITQMEVCSYIKTGIFTYMNG